jgi:hypothetical protein
MMEWPLLWLNNVQMGKFENMQTEEHIFKSLFTKFNTPISGASHLRLLHIF